MADRLPARGSPRPLLEAFGAWFKVGTRPKGLISAPLVTSPVSVGVPTQISAMPLGIAAQRNLVLPADRFINA